jgi:hypothetical protein
MRSEFERHAYANLGVIAGVFSAASFVISAFFLTYCVPVSINGTTGACVVQNWGAGVVLLFLGVGLLVTSLAAIGTAWSDIDPAHEGTNVRGPLFGDEIDGARTTPDEVLTAVTVRTKCQYCGSWSDPGSVRCKRCARPLTWSSPR